MNDPSQIPALTLLEYNGLVSNVVNSASHLMQRWVIAEVSNLKMSGPHCYGFLIYKDEKGVTVAKSNCTVWGNNWYRIYHKFLNATGRPISEGMKMMFLVSANHSPAYGLSLNVLDIDPNYTLGETERIKREILAALQREGIINRNKELPFPLAPQKIAIISSAGAAGYGDFINQIENSGFAFYPMLFTATLQGRNTAPTVLNALDRIEMAVDFWDCVVIIRGGGASDDLNSFDNLELARRVATFPLPVVVGIGHERDRTVLDDIANTRCKTPTAVAAFLIDTLAQAEQRAEDLARSIAEYVRVAMLGEERRLAQFSAQLPHLAPRRLETETHRIDLFKEKVAQLALARTADAGKYLGVATERIVSVARQALVAPQERLRNIPDKIRQIVDFRISAENQRLRSRLELIDVLSPAATLRRGYSITRINGKAVSNIAEVNPGDEISTTLESGEILSIISKAKTK